MRVCVCESQHLDTGTTAIKEGDVQVCVLFLAYSDYRKGQLQQIIYCDYVYSATKLSKHLSRLSTCTCLNAATGTCTKKAVYSLCTSCHGPL